MKSIAKIAIRYVLYAALLSMIILFFNLLVLVFCKLEYDAMDTENSIPFMKIAESFQSKDGELFLPEAETEKLSAAYCFSMMIDNAGEVIWEQNLPKEMHKTYTLQDINAASKWYLNGYPVRMWNTEYGILVAGLPQNSVWKYGLEYSMSGMNAALVAIPIGNLLLLMILCLFLGWRFYRVLKPVAQGIEELSQQKPVSMEKKGILSELSQRINKTSDLLMKQKELLEKRDTARTQWISGVSHDIRTPLSMIMGYADRLEQDDTLQEESKREAAIIRKQSIVIKELIEDLNLTSKLEYQMQPLHKEPYGVARIFREMIAAYYNTHEENEGVIYLESTPEAEQYVTMLDTRLFTRAVMNLIGNSVRHNSGKCTITIRIAMENGYCSIDYQDDGTGISPEVLAAFYKHHQVNATEGSADSVLEVTPDSISEPASDSTSEPASAREPHILGLYLIEEIILAHGGTFTLLSQEKGMKGRIVI